MGSKLKDFFKKDIITYDGRIYDAQERMKICISCPHLYKFTKQCSKCGCFMRIKTKIKSAHCPIRKW